MNEHGLLSRLDWRREFLQLMVLAMEVCWLYPWVALLDQWLTGQARFTSPFELFVLLVGLLWASRLLQQLPVGLGVQQTLLIPIVLLSALVLIKVHLYPGYPWFDVGWLAAIGQSLSRMSSEIPAEVEAIVVVGYCWWRALNLSQKTLDAGTVGFYFRVGVAGLVWYLLLTIFGPTADVTRLAFAFFFFGLIAMALARALEVDIVHEGRRSPFSGPWLSIVLGAVVGTLVIAALMAVILSRQTATAIGIWLRPITDALGTVLYYLFMVIAYLLQPLINALTSIFSAALREMFGSEEPIIQPAQPPNLADLQKAESPWWLGLCNWAALVFLLAIGLLIVVTTLRRWQEKRQAAGDLTRESVWSAEEFGEGLRAAWRQGWGKVGDLAGLVRIYGVGRKLYSAISVRKIYASLVDLATEKGFPRPQAATPYEYLPTLRRAFPQHGQEVGSITEAYVQVHYGEVPTSEGALVYLQGCWERIQNTSGAG
ncbi:MAG: DUF4129 domain-containing protein [Anaerolineae bacterium]|jgi:hypothetical protein|nr:DUF4129 domain-containing protein [Anaerolineae bacterium]MDH7473349.1 DUF4129 domain-containing protein [Anaerolineae bacterium]